MEMIAHKAEGGEFHTAPADYFHERRLCRAPFAPIKKRGDIVGRVSVRRLGRLFV